MSPAMNENERLILFAGGEGGGTVVHPQSNELTRGPPELVQPFCLGARALHNLNMIWFSCIALLSQWGRGG